MGAAHRLLRAALVGLLIAAVGFALYAIGKRRPGDVPWAPLDLGDPVGAFTGRKLAALSGDPQQCRSLMDRAGILYATLPERTGGQCAYDDAVRFPAAGGARRIALDPGAVGMSCPVAAAFALWEWQVVQPAARRHFGVRVTRIDHFGSYNCRRISGRDSGAWSEHATANALDIAGFRLSNGRRITVARDWAGSAKDRAFLRDVRDGACRLYATVLSPDYNAAHHDHFHLDQADRGVGGWRACR